MKGFDAIKEIGEELRKADDMKENRITPSARELLNNILGLIKRIDFKEKAGQQEDTKVSLKKYVVISIDELRKITEANDWGLCVRNDFVYIYNGAYWIPVSEEDFKPFLANAAGKMGVPDLECRYHKFKDELYEQFLSESVQPLPKRKSGTLINLVNGTFEITTEHQGLREFRRDDFLKYQLPFKYDKNAKCPMFDKYLNEVLPDKDCQKVLAEYIGYVFTTDLKLEKVLMLYGGGSNGKGVFFEIVLALLGKENVCNYSLQTLTKYDSYQRADLSNKLLNYNSENSVKVESSIFKQMASGEPVEARQIYGKPFVMENYAKLMFNCNSLPMEVEQTHAYFRRFLIVPFNVTIPEEEADIDLPKKIISKELSGIFNWVLDGLTRLLKQRHFTFSQAVKEQIELYKKESDSSAMFLEEYGYSVSKNNYCTLKGMYDEYKSFTVDCGYRAVSMKTFSERIRSKNFVIEKRRNGRIVYAERRFDL